MKEKILQLLNTLPSPYNEQAVKNFDEGKMQLNNKKIDTINLLNHRVGFTEGAKFLRDKLFKK